MLKLLDSLPTFDSEQDYALAIITDTNGSTYRKAGAMMLISTNLEYWGLISGGCLEGDILENCKDVFVSQSDKNLTYDMRGDEDLLWGLGLGCDGAVELLIKYLPAVQDHYGLFEILKSVDNGQSYLLSISLDNKNEISFSEINKSDYPKNNVQAEVQKGSLSLPLLAPSSILICGASPDVPPVTSIAKQLGWKTCVIDHRRDLASTAKFPDATRISHVKRSQWESFDLSIYDYAVVMSHQFERDQEYLSRLLESNISYIGLLGPSKRRNKLLEICETDFAHQQGRVFGPVGLDIGADTPEAIALAIIAEIQAVKANKSVGFCYQDANR